MNTVLQKKSQITRNAVSNSIETKSLSNGKSIQPDICSTVAKLPYTPLFYKIKYIRSRKIERMHLKFNQPSKILRIINSS